MTTTRTKSRHAWLFLITGALALALGLPASVRSETHVNQANIVAGYGIVTLEFHGVCPDALSDRIHEITVRAFSGAASENSFSQASQNVLAAFAAEGYHNAILKPRDFALDSGRLNFTMVVAPGPRTLIVGHEFDGLAHADTAWLRDVLSLPVDVPFTSDIVSNAFAAFDRVTFLRPRAMPTFEPTGDESKNRVPGILRWFVVEHRPARVEGLIAAGGDGAGSGLTGRAALQFGGLFGRDRSVALRYQRTRPEWTEFAVALNERGAFGAPVDWGLSVDEFRRHDRRQTLTGQVAWHLRRTFQINLGLLWRKTTPGSAATIPARTTEFAFGITKQGRGSRTGALRGTDVQLRVDGVLSRRRELASLFFENNFENNFENSAVTNNRFRIQTEIGVSHNLTRAWRVLISGVGRSWIDGSSTLGPGDEWYLGGADRLRGYEEQTLAAASGLWTTFELEWSAPSRLTMAVFGESAILRTIATEDNSTTRITPLSYGLALGLHAIERRARLEFAWRDKARWQDGIIRLHISQNW